MKTRSSRSSSGSPIACAVVGLKQGLETAYVLLHHPAFRLKMLCGVDPEPYGWVTGRLDPESSRQDFPHLAPVRKLLTEIRKSPGIDGIEPMADFATALQRPDIEAVALFVPDALHEEFTVAALRAGKYVLCTKPMALSIESAARIAEEAKRHPGHYMLGFHYTYGPFARRVLAEIKKGAVGAVRQISFQYHRGPFRPIYRKKAVSRGPVVQECCHWFDLFHLLNGESKFTRVVGFGGLDLHQGIQDVQDNGSLLIEYENQVRAALLFTYFRPCRHPEWFTLNGDRGQVRGSFDRLTIENDAGERTLEIGTGRRLPGLFHDGYYEMHDEFAAMIREGREPYSGWEAGLENTLISDAAQKALDGGPVVLRGGA